MADQVQEIEYIRPIMCGGLGQDNQANQEIQDLLDKLLHSIREKAGKNFGSLKAVSFRSQCVAGTNYFVKADAGDEHVHVRIFQPLPCYGTEPEVHGVQHSKTASDPIDYF